MVIAIFCKYKGYVGTIEFSDKDDLYHGRVKKSGRKITYEDGSVEYVTVEMADEPTETGTALNREAFMSLQGFAENHIVT